MPFPCCHTPEGEGEITPLLDVLAFAVGGASVVDAGHGEIAFCTVVVLTEPAASEEGTAGLGLPS